MNKILTVSLFLLFLPALAFKIDRVIVSSDSNPYYLDFWPIVAKAWQHMGIWPTLALVADKNTKVDETLGTVIRFDPIPDVPNGLYAQTVRLLVPAFFENEVLLISDVDMIPINASYFTESVAPIKDTKFVVYRDCAYGMHANQYPMCYNAAKGSTFKEIFAINSQKDIPLIVKQWAKKDLGWSTDERMLFFYLHQWKDFNTRCVRLAHTVCQRIDRSNWNYDVQLLKKNYYIDCHSVRPYKQYKKEIDALLHLLGID